MTARARLAIEVGTTAPLTLTAVRAIRAGADRYHDVYLLSLCDAALREFIVQGA